ncbi:MAG: ATP-binding protein [Proteobacteria bacterium]|nr:ATP-binding protein [Pseudomonadota bacterium]
MVALAPLAAAWLLWLWQAFRLREPRLLVSGALLLALSVDAWTSPWPEQDLLELGLRWDWSQLGVWGRIGANTAALGVVVLLAHSLRERNRAETVHWDAMEALRQLHALASQAGGRPTDLPRLLELGRAAFGVEQAWVARFEGEALRVVAQSPASGWPAPASVAEDDSWLARAVASDRPLAHEHLARGQAGPAGGEWGHTLLGAIGPPGAPLGLLAFGGPGRHTRRFTATDKEVWSSFADWLARLWTEQAAERERHAAERRLAVLTELIALRRRTPDDVLARLQKVLDLRAAALWQRVPTRPDELLWVTGVGFGDGASARASVPLHGPAVCALESGVAEGDWSDRAGATSHALCLRMPEPYALLSLHTESQRRFSAPEIAFCETVAPLLAAPTHSAPAPDAGRPLLPRRDDGVDRRRLDLNAVVADLVPAWRKVLPAGCQLEHVSGDELPGLALYRYELDRVGWGLVRATQRAFPDAARVEIRTEGVVSPTPGGSVRGLALSLQVAGRPLSGKALDALFHESEPRDDEPSSTASEGPLRLSLAGVRRLLQRHGGDVSVESAPDRGTTFTAWLPPATDA